MLHASLLGPQCDLFLLRIVAAMQESRINVLALARNSHLHRNQRFKKIR
jgi:hypothetical protein